MAKNGSKQPKEFIEKIFGSYLLRMMMLNYYSITNVVGLENTFTMSRVPAETTTQKIQ